VQFATVLTDIGAEHVYNDTILYECDVGFELVGVSERRCLETGEWSDDDPHCEQVGNSQQRPSTCFTLGASDP
jgi:hypothetical protein